MGANWVEPDFLEEPPVAGSVFEVVEKRANPENMALLNSTSSSKQAASKYAPEPNLQTLKSAESRKRVARKVEVV